jgi:hypothetical protein
MSGKTEVKENTEEIIYRKDTEDTELKPEKFGSFAPWTSARYLQPLMQNP